MSPTRPEIVVAGDVCIDWLSVPIHPALPSPGAPPPQNWQLRGGRSLHARRGGAWLTADFAELAVGDRAAVHKPESRGDLRSIAPDQLIHSMLTLDAFERKQAKETVKVWGVHAFEGFTGPESGTLANPPAPEKNPPNAAVVVLDDAGNGFRDLGDGRGWPVALKPSHRPVVLYKVRRPLLKGKLWDRLQKSHLDRTIAMLNADELREEGALISRRLSWEHTAADIILTLLHEDTFRPLSHCEHVIVMIGLEGVIHLYRADAGTDSGANRSNQASLSYVPDLIEGDLLQDHRRGGMTGFSSAFAAAIVAAIVKASAGAGQAQGGVEPPTFKVVQKGIREGMVAARYLLELAYGPARDASNSKATVSAPDDASPAYPRSGLFGQKKPPDFAIHQVQLPTIPDRGDARATNRFRHWRILDAVRSQTNRSMRDLARDVALRGLKEALPKIPVARFNDLETIDRWEIENYRSIRNLFREFLKNPQPERPLCIAVFGRPGSGKSFGVTEVAKSVEEEHPIEKFDFNLSQWKSADELAVALHRVRGSGLRRRVPLVFFDEFDSFFDTKELGWLKHFLAPMNEGVFTDGRFTHPMGPAILVFAGGTCANFQEFCKKTAEAKKDIKAPDFLSRLRGNVDVFGPDPLADTRMLSRAMILRRALAKRSKRLFDEGESLRIDPRVLAAFLNVWEFRHGARSIEAIVEMSQLQDHQQFAPSMLPPPMQMRLHVEPEEFMRIIQHWRHLESQLEAIAEAIHEHFVEGLLSGVNDPVRIAELRALPGRQKWAELNMIYKDSSRDQAAHIPAKLAAVGCDLVPIQPGDPADEFDFTADELKILAPMEHVRFVAERSQKQPDHPDLIPWDDLSEPSRDKDRRHIRDLPEILRQARLRIIRIR
jgi:hypothetical protein